MGGVNREDGASVCGGEKRVVVWGAKAGKAIGVGGGEKGSCGETH